MLTCKMSGRQLQAADLAPSVDGDVAAFAAVALLHQPQQESAAVHAAGREQEGGQQESVFSPAHTLQPSHITAQQLNCLKNEDLIYSPDVVDCAGVGLGGLADVVHEVVATLVNRHKAATALHPLFRHHAPDEVIAMGTESRLVEKRFPV